MTRTTHSIPIWTLSLSLLAGVAPATAEDSWQLRVSGVSAQSTAGGGSNGELGGGLALEYRATPRIGVELGGLTTDYEDEISLGLFGAPLLAESEFRMTPILARLNVHLTPDRRFDLYAGPVAGYVLMSDLTYRIHIQGLEFDSLVFEAEYPTEDQFTWGAHAGFDVRLGGGSSFLSAGATWLDLPLEIDLPPFGIPENPDRVSTDFDPLVVHVGYSYRF